MNDGLLATDWAISAGERYYLAGSAKRGEVEAACDAALGAYAELTERYRPFTQTTSERAHPKASAARCAAWFTLAIIRRYPSFIIEHRLERARNAFMVAYL